jgi:hypothetical protein
MSGGKYYTFTTSGVSPFVTTELQVKQDASINGDLTVLGERMNGAVGE